MPRQLFTLVTGASFLAYYFNNPACLAVKLLSTKMSFSPLRLLKSSFVRRFRPTKLRSFK